MSYDDIAKFGKTKASHYIAFFWGLAEGLLFFVVPDVYLSFIGLFTLAGGVASVGFALLGSLVSAVLVFLLAPYFGNSYSHILTNIPGVSGSMVDKVAAGLHNYGITNILSGPLGGVPYKIYSAEAALQHLPLIPYLLWSIPARLERMLPVTLVALILGYFFKNNIRKYTKFWIIGFTVVWILIYINYYHSLS